MSDDGVFRGKIQFFDGKKRWGFVRSPERKSDVFIHLNARRVFVKDGNGGSFSGVPILSSSERCPASGDDIVFSIGRNEKGECAAPWDFADARGGVTSAAIPQQQRSFSSAPQFGRPSIRGRDRSFPGASAQPTASVPQRPVPTHRLATPIADHGDSHDDKRGRRDRFERRRGSGREYSDWD